MGRYSSRRIQRATDAVTTTIREHPVPLAMIAVGIGWMAWSLRSERNRYRRWGETPERVAERLRETAEFVRTRTQAMAGSIADSARETARRSAARAARSYEAHPLTMGAVAMTAGVATGLAVPMTDPELRWMGNAREDVVDRVRSFAQETRERVDRVTARMAVEADDLEAMESPHQAT